MPRSDDTPALPDEHSCEPRSWLCPNFTFANFVVGRCNRLAYDAARPIASSPSLHTAPLFLFGGNGTGKTHLLHAIGHEVAHHFRSVRAVCTTSEQFVNHFISCSRAERMERFRDFYGALDLLLVDHVQLLGNKVRTRGEFLKTVNTMLDARKRVVLASDATPREIPGFTKGLLSRFRQIGVGPPDIATKLAMLDSKARGQGVRLPIDVRLLIANAATDVRELEGAVTRLNAYGSLIGAPITMTFAEHVLNQR